jgi:predicted small lipoprotein YifL
MKRVFQFVMLLALTVGLAGCGSKDLTYSGPVYPPTATITKVFQPGQVPRSCRVFAEVVALMPANLTGREVENTILAEAGRRGAEMVLFGQSRQGKDSKTQFLYFGPQREYPFAEFWSGWKFGYSLWKEQGDWLNIGYNELGSDSVRYDVPLAMQLAMLRCH